MAQNIVSHRRNYKSLVDTFEKVGAILLRMETLERSIHANMRDLEAHAVEDDNQSNLAELKEMVYTHLADVEHDAKNDMKESLEPVAPYLLRRKREGELDDFIGHVLNYVEVDATTPADDE